MKRLADFSDDINKCSKCGKCQEVCPVFKLTKNDCAVSKGKFIMLQGVLKGDLRLTKTIEKYVDLCLKCGKCREFCPSDIDVCKIFKAVKYEYSKDSFFGEIIKFLQSDKVFNEFLGLGKLFRRHKIKTSGSVKLLYFKGCANKFYPKSENALKKILPYFDVDLVEKDFECCGVPLCLERYEEVKRKNLELLQGDYDYIVTDCASCQSALADYSDELNVINICQFLASQNKKFVFDKPLKVTFHKPCHLKSDAFLKPLLNKCENVEYIEAKDYDECCGFAGEFALKNPKISLMMTQQKASNLAATNADIILTACPACIIGINMGFLGKKHPKIMNIVEFLALANRINCI